MTDIALLLVTVGVILANVAAYINAASIRRQWASIDRLDRALETLERRDRGRIGKPLPQPDRTAHADDHDRSQGYKCPHRVEYDVTRFGDPHRTFMCGSCGRRRNAPHLVDGS